MVAFAAAVTRVFRDAGIRPDYAAGLSLGEYSALCCAGVFTAAQAVELAAFRGRAMEEAAAGRRCGMTALLGASQDRVWASVSGGASKQVFFSSNPKVSSGMSKMGRTAGQQA